jgi:autotransporter-associated beta strand protein
VCAGLAAACVSVVPSAQAAITYSIAGSWDSDARRDAAIAAMDAAVGRYNAYGTFNKTITVTYNSGVATADGNYNGSIRFGGTWPNERVALHEIGHTLGIGTTGNYAGLMTGGNWDGASGLSLLRQFDGLESTLNGDGAHFWPYGLNFDSEGAEINRQRHVAMLYAMRADMGLGPAAHPSTATIVFATATNPLGESGFNYKGQWSDGYFPHAGAAYFTGNFAVRTPVSSNSFTFAGNSLTINNTGDPNGGLYYKGIGASGIVTINNLTLAGGRIHHLAGVGDLFQLAGNLSVTAPSIIHARQGNINLLANITGSGDITIPLTDNPAEDNRFVRLLAPNSGFTGGWIVNGRLQVGAGTSSGGLGSGSIANNGTIVFHRIGAFTVSNAVSGPGRIVNNGAGILTFTGDNTYSGGTTINAGTLIAARLSNGPLTINAGTAQITVKPSPNDPGGTTQVPSLTINGTSTLDLTNNALVIDYAGSGPSPSLPSTIRQYLASGRIISSTGGGPGTRLGYADNAVLAAPFTSFAGVPVDVGALLMQWTRGGDTDLDGDVDVADLGNLASKWQTAGVWTGGDFDYSGSVDVADLGILASNWQTGVAGSSAPSLGEALAAFGLPGASVPEPATCGLLSALAAWSLKRPGRRRSRHPAP